jgi:hypothetical protein
VAMSRRRGRSPHRRQPRQPCRWVTCTSLGFLLHQGGVTAATSPTSALARVLCKRSGRG